MTLIAPFLPGLVRHSLLHALWQVLIVYTIANTFKHKIFHIIKVDAITSFSDIVVVDPCRRSKRSGTCLTDEIPVPKSYGVRAVPECIERCRLLVDAPEQLLCTYST